MKRCEYCNNEHDASYASGRFCKAKCAHAFTTAAKRKEINKKVSKTLTGRPLTGDSGFKKGFDKRRLNNCEAIKRYWAIKYSTMTWQELPLREKRRRILIEQNNTCVWCQLNTWRGQKLLLELDHINGDKQDERRENLRFMCPNCHSQTVTFRKPKRLLVNFPTEV